MPLLEVDRLNTWFRPRRRARFRRDEKPVKAVDDVSFAIAEREMVGLIGNLGSGKSTLAHSLVRLAPVTSGSVKFEDREILKLSQRAFLPLRRKMQIVFQNAIETFRPGRSVGWTLGETIRSHNAKLSAAAVRESAAGLLDFVGLTEDTIDRHPSELRHGEAERIALARALAPQPRFLIIDDTLRALDPIQQREFVELLLAARDELGLACLWICDDLALLTKLADRIMVMSRGRIVEDAPVRQLVEEPQHDFTKKLLESTLTLD